MAGLREALSEAFDEHAEKSEFDADKENVLPQKEPPVVEEKEVVVAEEKPVKEDKPAPEKVVAEKTEPAAEKPAVSVKSPVSWRPDVRDKFGSLPPEVQAEVNRREGEINTALRDASESRKFHKEFQEVISPYMAQIQAEGGTPIGAIRNLMNTAYQLRHAMPSQKADLVAQMVMQFNVPIQMLDQALAARAQGQQLQQDPVAAAVAAQMAPVQQFMQQMQSTQQQYQQRQVQEAEQSISQFANDPKNEFYADVSGDMADLLEMAANRGQNMSIQAAYDRAILLHPEISEVVAKRKMAQEASQRQQTANRARKAGASISNEAPQHVSSGKSTKPGLRASLEEAWDAAQSKAQ